MAIHTCVWLRIFVYVVSYGELHITLGKVPVHFSLRTRMKFVTNIQDVQRIHIHRVR